MTTLNILKNVILWSSFVYWVITRVDMKISYAITVCNEFVEIQRLIHFLRKNKRQQDEIVSTL